MPRCGWSPDGLTLLSAERDCGSEECSETYLIGSPDGASRDEVAERLWTHLVEAKGWQRLRDDAGCVQPGWPRGHEFCGFILDQPPPPEGVLRFFVSGALTAGSAAGAGPSVGGSTVGPCCVLEAGPGLRVQVPSG